jgi:tetratricopeptide (TPR) repeat protein
MSEPGGEWFRDTLHLRDEVMRQWLADKRSANLDELLAVDAELMPALEDHERVMLLRSQIRQLWDRMSRNGSAGDLAMIIEAARNVCRLAHPPTNKDLSDLCYFLQPRYERTRDVADVREAVAVGRRSVRDPSGDPHEQAVHLSNLFGAVIAFAENAAAGSPDAFTEAVQVAERAVRLFPADSPARTKQMANLATALWSRFQATEVRDDLDRSIACGQQALDASRPDDPGLSELRASLLVALTMRFHRFDDDTALEQALAALRQGDPDASPGWMQSLRGLIDSLTQRLERGGIDRHRQIRDGLLVFYEKGLMLVSTQMMGAGATTRDLALIDSALDVLREAAELGGESRRAMYRGLRGECLIRRWQITKAWAELDTAIDLLIEASEAEDDRALAGQHGKAAATALVRRFRRRRRAEDLAEAERLLERAVTLVPPSETELHDEMRSLARYIHGATTAPPLLLNQSDLGEADREDLSSPYDLSNQLAWNEGKPRFSGLTWVHTREDEAGLPSVPPADTEARRVLFLRTFMEDDSNFVILNSLALALDDHDSVEIVGDSSDRPLVERHWRMAFGTDARPESRINFVTSTEDGWRRDVLDRICRADAIVLFISPRDADFPEFPFPSTTTQIGGASDWGRFMDAPLALPLTGPGLLREICYLNRLQRLPDTVVVCASKYQTALDDLIALAGTMGTAVDMADNPVTPKLTAADKQVGHLRKAFRGITYHRTDNREIMLNLAQAIRRALREVRAEKHPRHTVPWTPQELCGTSPHPRHLPPDNELKVIAFTDVENIFFILPGRSPRSATRRCSES